MSTPWSRLLLTQDVTHPPTDGKCWGIVSPRCSTGWRHEMGTSLSVENQHTGRKTKNKNPTEKQKSFDLKYLYIQLTPGRSPRRPLRKTNRVDLDIRRTLVGRKSGENDSISIYSSFVCHFTALDTHGTTRTGVHTSLSMMGEKWIGQKTD